jgi:hypothetical protein
MPTAIFNVAKGATNADVQIAYIGYFGTTRTWMSHHPGVLLADKGTWQVQRRKGMITCVYEDGNEEEQMALLLYELDLDLVGCPWNRSLEGKRGPAFAPYGGLLSGHIEWYCSLVDV